MRDMEQPANVTYTLVGLNPELSLLLLLGLALVILLLIPVGKE
jgi:hypothetical protein